MSSSPTIDAVLVRRLVASQFPQWKDLAITPVKKGGWDNRTFHLGVEMLVRMPSAECYAAQVEKEQRWLPYLAPLLPLSVPVPLALGEPGYGYPWKWSIYKWLEGESAASAPLEDLDNFAVTLAHFLKALQSIDATGGPQPGPQSFYRGGSLTTYDAEARRAIALLKNKIDALCAIEVWEKALTSTCHGASVWVHGDISTGNLLVKEGHLSGVIDFGQLAVGDPACDLAIAWTFFTGESRELFRSELKLDEGTWARGRGWALWKALIIAAGLTDTNAFESAGSLSVIEGILRDYKRKA